jgi:transposase
MRAQFAAMHGTLEKLQRHVFGRRSEKMPSVAEAIRDPARAEAERIATIQTRRENAEKKRQLVTRKLEHKVREDQKTCPKCGRHDFSRLGDGHDLHDVNYASPLTTTTLPHRLSLNALHSL